MIVTGIRIGSPKYVSLTAYRMSTVSPGSTCPPLYEKTADSPIAVTLTGTYKNRVPDSAGDIGGGAPTR